MFNFFRPEKYVFYHIPKTGGTTLQVWADQFFDVREICPRTFFKPSALSTQKLNLEQKKNIQRYRFIRDHFFMDITSQVRGKVRAFTMLRNPMRRVLSQFYYYRKYSDEDIHLNLKKGIMSESRAQAIRQLREISLQNFLKQGSEVLRPDFYNTQALMMAHLPASDAQMLQPKKIVERAWLHLRRLDAFGLLELFEPSMQLFCFTFGWRYPQSVCPLNQGVYSDQLSEESEALLNPWIDLDKQLYLIAQKEFMVRYRSMVKTLLMRAGFKKTELVEAVRNAFSPDIQQAVVSGLRQDEPQKIFSFLRSRNNPYCRTKKSSIQISMDQALLGDGWFEREGFADNKTLCRWSGPENVSSLWVLVVPKQSYLFSAVILEVLHSEILSGLKVFANAEELELTIELITDRSGRIQAVIPASAASEHGLLQIRFEVPFTMSHYQFCGSADKRRKGIRISEVLLSWFSTRYGD